MQAMGVCVVRAQGHEGSTGDEQKKVGLRSSSSRVIMIACRIFYG